MKIEQKIFIIILIMVAGTITGVAAVYSIVNYNIAGKYLNWSLYYIAVINILFGVFIIYFLNKAVFKRLVLLREQNKKMILDSTPSYSVFKENDELADLGHNINWLIDELKNRKIRDSENQLKSVFDATGNALIVTDILANITDCNETALTMFKYAKKSDLISKNIRMLTSLGQEEVLFNYLKIIKKNNSPGGQEIYFADRNGKIFPGEIFARQIKKSPHEALILFVIKDNTPWVYLNNLLYKNSQNHYFSMDAMQTQIWYLKDVNTYGYVNESHAGFLGYSNKNLINKELKEVLPRDMYDLMQSVVKAFKKGQKCVIEGWIKNHAGERRLIEITSTPKISEQRKTEFVFCVAEDITDQRRALNKLKDCENRYQYLTEFQQYYFMALNTGNELISFNEALVKRIGKYKEELKGISILKLIHQEDIDMFLSCMNNLKMPPYRTSIKHRLLTFLGWRRIAWEFCALKNDEGHTVEILAVGRDVTDDSMDEESIKKSLEERNVMLKEIHHRVKNNLQVISSLLYLQSSQTNDNKIMKALKDSENRVRAMALLHESIYQSDNLAEVNIKIYIENLVRKLLISHKSPDLDLNIDMKLEKIFLNIEAGVPIGLVINELVCNALEHAFTGDKPSGKIWINIFQKNNSMTVSVADNGQGLPLNFDLDNNKKLGLQLVKSLVKQMAGSMHVDSSANGLKYTIELVIRH